jgi:hypothetical protein
MGRPAERAFLVGAKLLLHFCVSKQHYAFKNVYFSYFIGDLETYALNLFISIYDPLVS